MIQLDIKHTATRSQYLLLEEWSRKIARQEWRRGDFLGSDLALSEQFGVSRTVVRGTLDILERHSLIRREPRRGILLAELFTLEAARDEKNSNTIFFIRWVDDALTFDIGTGLTEEAQRCNCTIQQALTHQSETALIELLNNIPGGCRNVVLLPIETPAVIDAIRRALARGIRLVQLDRYIEGLDASSILFDNYRGGALATRHLLKLHPGPVYFFGCLNPVSCRKRHQGWQDSMKEAGFEPLDAFIVPYPEDSRAEVIDPEVFQQECRRHLHRFLKLHPEPMSFFAVNDRWAQLLYAETALLNRQIGKDIFVVGFDNLDLCERLTPPLSSIAVPRRQLGCEAVKLLAENNRKLLAFAKILPVELIERESSTFKAPSLR